MNSLIISREINRLLTTDKTPSRQLAAIMSARRSVNVGGFIDIVGYTALIGDDKRFFRNKLTMAS